MYVISRFAVGIAPRPESWQLRCGEKYKDAEFGTTSNDFMPQVRRFVSCDGLQEQSTHENENKMANLCTMQRKC